MNARLPDVHVVVIGGGVVGCAVALALARRGASIIVLEAEAEPGLAASGTNSGILHTGFDSTPGELETELILTSGRLRDEVVDALQIPVLRCGALMRPRDDSERGAVRALRLNAARNGVAVTERDDGDLEIPREAVTDPVLYTLALANAAASQGADLRMESPVVGLAPDKESITVRTAGGTPVRCIAAVNCAGLHADSVARLVGDESFSIFPRKGEFLVFEPPEGKPLERIILPVPSERTKGVLVFPTLDGMVVAGPTAVDQVDKRDWSVRPNAASKVLSRARAMYPPLADAPPIASYAGLRPAGRGVNYVIGPSPACPRLINVAAIRSTGLTASLGIARRVAEMMVSLGVAVGPERELGPGSRPSIREPWWRRTASYRAVP